MGRRAARNLIRRLHAAPRVPALLLVLLVTAHLAAAHHHPLSHVTVHPSMATQAAAVQISAERMCLPNRADAMVTDGDAPCTIRQNVNAPALSPIAAAGNAPQPFERARRLTTLPDTCAQPRPNGPTRQAALQRFTL